MSEHTVSNVYRVEGFSCAGCAGAFEKNVKKLDGVTDAKVNFGASKITVYGSTNVAELEQAGAFEKLKVRPEHERTAPSSSEEQEPTSFIQKHMTLIGSLLFLLFGFLSYGVNGEDNLVTVLAFATSMVIGGYTLFKQGLLNLTRLQFDMRTLMTIAVIGAAIIGEWTEGAIVVILFAISEALERFSMNEPDKPFAHSWILLQKKH